jgi:hypothetical protein
VTALFAALQALVATRDWRVSDHAYDRITMRGLSVSAIVDGIAFGVPIEHYPDYYAGPCVLALQNDRQGPVHALWGLEKHTSRPAVLVTAYRPDPQFWKADNRSRR